MGILNLDDVPPPFGADERSADATGTSGRLAPAGEAAGASPAGEGAGTEPSRGATGGG